MFLTITVPASVPSLVHNSSPGFTGPLSRAWKKMRSPTATRSSGFVGEFGPTGELMRATYLGGSGGMSGASGVAVDGSGNVHVTGWTAAADFPLAGTGVEAFKTQQLSLGGGAWFKF